MNNSNKAVFLDRDGVINYNKNYIYKRIIHYSWPYQSIHETIKNKIRREL